MYKKFALYVKSFIQLKLKSGNYLGSEKNLSFVLLSTE